MAIWTILVFPALFTSGMSLIDTLDSTFMTRAYGWALIEPQRKLYYNFAITFASVLIAIGVGISEIFALVPDRQHLLSLPQWGGLSIVGLFAALWLSRRWLRSAPGRWERL